MEDGKSNNGALSDEQKLKITCLSDALKRYDSYIGTTNFKSGLLITFNAAIFGGLILKAGDLIKPGYLKVWIILALIIISVLSLLSIAAVINTIWPNLKSASNAARSEKTNEPPSILFFKSVADNFDATTYADRISSINYLELERDLAIQVHEVATVTLDKHVKIATAAKHTRLNIYALFCLGFFIVLQSGGQ